MFEGNVRVSKESQPGAGAKPGEGLGEMPAEPWPVATGVKNDLAVPGRRWAGE